VLGHFLKPEYEELIAQKDWESLRVAFEDLHPADIAEVLDDLPPEDSGVIFRILPREVAGTAFEYLPLDQQAELITALGSEQLVNVLNGMSPDDRTRLFEELPAEVTRRALSSLNPDELKVARQLLGYPENSAGRYMTTEYLSIRPSMTAREALDYVRSHGKGRETLNVEYVTDEKGVLLYDVRLSDIVLAQPETTVSDIPSRHMVALPATAPRAEVVSAFEKYDRVALPVVDSKGVLVGIITVDDVLDVAEAEATEDIQKLGGMEALDAPYLEISAWEMFKKRGGWLSILMVSEMLTATAMSYFEDEIARAVVLALFIPLIMSSGGNSGSQATSLIIRGLAVRDIEVKDWWRVLARELRSGVMLGALLASIGMARIVFWPARDVLYGPHYFMVALTVALSLIGVVLFGSLAGSMLPFILRRLGFDPAAASAPFVATLVDVTGLVIYFTVASLVLSGTLLSRGAVAGEALGPAAADLAAHATSGCSSNLLLHPR
jgi:magnesium transporter